MLNIQFYEYCIAQIFKLKSVAGFQAFNYGNHNKYKKMASRRISLTSRKHNKQTLIGNFLFNVLSQWWTIVRHQAFSEWDEAGLSRAYTAPQSGGRGWPPGCGSGPAASTWIAPVPVRILRGDRCRTSSVGEKVYTGVNYREVLLTSRLMPCSTSCMYMYYNKFLAT